jgi:hypothetical protein
LRNFRDNFGERYFSGKTWDYVAVEAVIGEPVSASYSLFRGKIQGNFDASSR